MKKITALMLSAILSLGLAACGSNGSTGSQSSPQEASASDSQNSVQDTALPEPDETADAEETASEVPGEAGEKTLVVYFSVPETTDPDNMTAEEANSTVVINGEVLGNTQYVAYVIRENTGADLFRIEPETPYPMDHAELEAVATEQKNQNARPVIAGQVDDMDQYGTVFIGYPNWYAEMPMILYSFLEQYDLSGKTVIPFVTSGSSGFSNTISSIEELQPDANVVREGFSVTRNVVQDAEPDIVAWLAGLGYAG